MILAQGDGRLPELSPMNAYRDTSSGENTSVELSINGKSFEARASSGAGRQIFSKLKSRWSTMEKAADIPPES